MIKFATALPDRLTAGPQILVLIVVVRIHLGQQPSPYPERVFYFCLLSSLYSIYAVQKKNYAVSRCCLQP